VLFANIKTTCSPPFSQLIFADVNGVDNEPVLVRFPEYSAPAGMVKYAHDFAF
jgi:hypothetical protein